MSQEYKDLEIAKAERSPVSHLWNNDNWIADEKCDGWRLQLHFGKPCSRLYAITRGGEDIGQNIPHLAPQVDISNLQYTVLDGELIPLDGQEFHSLAGVRAGKMGRVAFKLFDVLFLNGIDVRGLSLSKRIELVDVVIQTIYSNNQFILSIKRAIKDTYKFLVEQLAKGEEGVVLKDLRASYGNGWIKAKKFSTFDAIITGIEPGYHTPHGKVHLSVCDGAVLREVGKCGIQVDEVRAKLNKDPNSFMGAVVEVKALKIDPSNGLLREPRFVRMRPDLKPLDCTWEKLNRDALKIELE